MLNKISALSDLGSESTDALRRAGMVDVDGSLLFMLGLFLVFTVLLHFLVVKPLRASQNQRHAGMSGARGDASDAELKAAETKLAYDVKLTAGRQAAVEVREGFKADAGATARDLQAQVKSETDAVAAKASAELEVVGNSVRADIDVQAKQLASILVDKLIATGAKA